MATLKDSEQPIKTLRLKQYKLNDNIQNIYLRKFNRYVCLK